MNTLTLIGEHKFANNDSLVCHTFYVQKHTHEDIITSKKQSVWHTFKIVNGQGHSLISNKKIEEKKKEKYVRNFTIYNSGLYNQM